MSPSQGSTAGCKSRTGTAEPAGETYRTESVLMLKFELSENRCALSVLVSVRDAQRMEPESCCLEGSAVPKFTRKRCQSSSMTAGCRCKPRKFVLKYSFLCYCRSERFFKHFHTHFTCIFPFDDIHILPCHSIPVLPL